MTYFIIEDNRQQGPFTIEELSLRHLTSETLVWTEGMDNWTPAWKVAELRALINGGQPKPATPPPFPVHKAQADHLANGAETASGSGETNGPTDGRQLPEKRNHTSWLAGLIALLVVLLLMAVTNPPKEAHENAIRKEMTEAFDDMATTRSDDIFERGLSMIGRMIGQNLFQEAISQMISYHNYGVFSTTTVSFDGRSHKVSFGCLGHVWTMNSDDIERAVSGNASVRHENRLQQDEDQRSSQDDRQDMDPQEEQMQQDDPTGDDGTGDLEEYVQQQTNKALDKVGAKVKEAVKNRMKETADSTASSEVGHLVDKILELLAI